jgi:FkbM family methyltransferase
MRKIFLDCGAHDGCSVEMFINSHDDSKDYEIYSFECDELRFKQLSAKGIELGVSKFYPIKKAVWISDGKKIFDGWQLTDTVNSDDNAGIESIDLSKFILDNFSKDDYIVLKMDIEGAEYKVIDKMDKDGSLSYISKIYGELHGPKKGYSIEDNNNLLNKVWRNNLKLLNWDALEGSYDEIEIVPINSPGSYKTASSPRVGHAYKKYMNKITFCIPSKSNLRYLKTCIPSIRENAYRDDHEIIIFVDSDEDGTVEWLKQVKDQYNLTYYVNPKLGESLFGIGKAYDFCIEHSITDIFMIFHADMMLGKHADFKAYQQLKEKTVVCSTRVEPPIHPNAGEKILLDFGMWPEEFKKEEFNQYIEEHLNDLKTTDGVFAPWMMNKKEYLSILGGHDPQLHSCREDSDLFNRMLLAGFNFIQPWNSLVYHLTGRGAGSFDGDHERHRKWQEDMHNSTLAFIKKWGTNVQHTPLMKPIVSPVYKKSLKINNTNPNIGDLENTLNTWFNGGQDIIVEVDANNFTSQDFQVIQQLNNIIKDSGEIGMFQIGNLKITINNLTEYQDNLIYL